MAMLRINDEIKSEVMPILDELGISLSEAVNMYLHQIKNYNGIPLYLRTKDVCEVNEIYEPYVCKHGYVHDYRKLKKHEIIDKEYHSIDELKKDIEGE